MKVIIHQSTDSIFDAVKEFKKKVRNNDNPNITAILCLVSAIYNSEVVIANLHSTFPNIKDIYGVTTQGEFASGADEFAYENSIVLVGFTDEAVKSICCTVIPSDHSQLDENFNSATDLFSKHFNKSISELDPKEYVSMMLLDGMSSVSYKIIEKFKSNTNVKMVGGLAGSNVTGKTTVYANGQFYEHASLIMILKVGCKFHIEKIEAFNASEETVTITNLKQDGYVINEINGKPAFEYYCESLGIDCETISEQRFMEEVIVKNPFALKKDNTIYVRDISTFPTDRKTLQLYCPIDEGSELILCNSINLIEHTTKKINEIVNKYNSISGTIIFSCFGIYLHAIGIGKLQEYITTFEALNACGFFSYGEIYAGNLANRTASMLLFE